MKHEFSKHSTEELEQQVLNFPFLISFKANPF